MATDRTVLVRLKANVSDFNRGMMEARRSLHGLTDEIDTTNDRTAWLAQSVLGLGPAFVPLAAGAVPVMSGLATQMTVAALAAGTAVLAFQGVGDGLKALNDYQLKPTTENFAKMQEAFKNLGPAGEEFVRFLDDVGPKFSQLGMTAREGMFPGFEEGILSFTTLLPQLDRIVRQVSEGMGELGAASGETLAGPRFAAFFDYLEHDAKPILLDMGRTLGGFAEGLANMLVGFGPLSADFSAGFADMAMSFAEWSRGLDSNDSFQSFLSYIQEVGPLALDFLGSLVDAFVSIVHAAAPVGEVLLPIFSGFLDVIGLIANTPLGSTFVALGAVIGLVGRSMALLSVTSGGVIGKVTQLSLANARAAFSTRTLATDLSILTRNALTAGAATQRMAAGSRVASSNIRTQGRALAGTAAQVGALALVSTGAADKVGLANTAMLGLAGSMAGPFGAAAGVAVGLFLDLRDAAGNVEGSLKGVDRAVADSNLTQATKDLDALLAKQKDINDVSGVKDFFSDIKQSGGASLLNFAGDITIDGIDEAIEKVRTLRELGATDAFSGVLMAIPNTALDSWREQAAATRDAESALSAYMSTYDAFQGRLSRAQGLITLRDSFRELRKVVDDNPLGKNLNLGAQGDAVRGQLLDIISNVHNVAKGMDAVDQAPFLKRKRAEILAAARALDLPIGKVRAMLKDMGILDRTKASPKVEEKGSGPARTRVQKLRAEIAAIKSKMVHMDEKGAAAAAARIRALQREIAQLRDKDVHINYIRRVMGVGPTGIQQKKADGGIVYAGPGQSRGPMDDSIDARLSHREAVSPVRAVDFYGEDFFEAIRTLRYPKPAQYANGFTPAASPRVSVAAPNVNVGGTAVKVIIDGREVRAIVVDEIEAREDMAGVRRG